MNRSEAISIVYKQYSELSEMNRDRFAELANMLLQTNYFVEKKVNVEEFRFLIANASLFSAYFSLIDIDFGIDQAHRYAYLKNAQKHSKLSLNLLESQVLLSLRYLYQMKFSEVTLSDDVAVYYSDLSSELKRTGASRIISKRMTLSLFLENIEITTLLTMSRMTLRKIVTQGLRFIRRY